MGSQLAHAEVLAALQGLSSGNEYLRPTEVSAPIIGSKVVAHCETITDELQQRSGAVDPDEFEVWGHPL